MFNFADMKITIINGPNLNLTGTRQPEWYGTTAFDEFIKAMAKKHAGVELDYFQSNIEGELIDRIQYAGQDEAVIGIVLNAGAYSHTSIAIADAVSAIKTPVIGVHLSNIYRRETERHTDLLSASCVGNISGLGLAGYEMALEFFKEKMNQSI